MHEEMQASLSDAAIETFGHLAYLFAELGPCDPCPPAGAEGLVVVAFRGPFHGGLALQLSGGVLWALADSMLGLDEPPSLHSQYDALGETANIICGNVLPRVVGRTAVFALGVPTRYDSWSDAVLAIGGLSTRIRLNVEGGRADLALTLTPSA